MFWILKFVIYKYIMFDMIGFENAIYNKINKKISHIGTVWQDKKSNL
jgi:hypothetical protein